MVVLITILYVCKDIFIVLFYNNTLNIMFLMEKITKIWELWRFEKKSDLGTDINPNKSQKMFIFSLENMQNLNHVNFFKSHK